MADLLLLVGTAKGLFILRRGGNGRWSIDGPHFPGEFSTLEDALDSLWKRHAALRDRVLTETGDIREHVNIFAGTQNIKRKNGLATKLEETEIHIFNAVSGG